MSDVMSLQNKQANWYIQTRKLDQQKKVESPAPVGVGLTQQLQLQSAEADQVQINDRLGLNQDNKSGNADKKGKGNRPTWAGGPNGASELPPGLQKKDSLPGNNPWSRVLEQKKAEAEQKEHELAKAKQLQGASNPFAPQPGQPTADVSKQPGVAQLMTDLAKLFSNVANLEKLTRQQETGREVSSDREAVDSGATANEADANVEIAASATQNQKE